MELDFFNDFDNSDNEQDEKTTENRRNYPDFAPNIQNKFWFRDVSKENQTATAVIEIDLFRVADLCHERKFDEAKAILTELREKTKNNRTHEVMLIDSILQCYIGKDQLSSSEVSDTLDLLSEYESLLVDFGDQIQFLRTKGLILSKLPEDHKMEFKNTVALLCELCGSFENWQVFETGIKFLSDTEKLGIKLKMEKILKYEIEHSRGFVKERLEEKKLQIAREAEEVERKIGEEKANQIRSSLSSHKETQSSDSAPSAEFRAHESRSKNKLIPKSEQSAAISDFSRRFPFLFL